MLLPFDALIASVQLMVGDPRKIAVVTPQGWIGAEHHLLGIFFLGCGSGRVAAGLRQCKLMRQRTIFFGSGKALQLFGDRRRLG